MYKVYNKRSNEVINGKAKLPTPEQLEYGEIAINYAKGKEALAIKNDEDEIVKLPFTGGSGESGIFAYRDENHEDDGIFPDKQALYDSLRDHIKRGENLFEPEEGKMCVAFVKNDWDESISTYPIINPEPSYNSIVDPEKTKRDNEIKSHRLPYNGDKIVVRRHLFHQPMVHLPYYFQDCLCVFRKSFEEPGQTYTFKYNSSLLEFKDVIPDSYSNLVDVEVYDIDENGCDKELVLTRNDDKSYHFWVMVRFDMYDKNVFEAINRIYDDNDRCYVLNENTIKLECICHDFYRSRTTLSPYLKLEWGNYTSGGGDVTPYNFDENKPKLINIRPSLWKGIIENLDEKIYPNREPERYNMFIKNVFGDGQTNWPKPRYRVRSKIRNYIPVYGYFDNRRKMVCIYPELSGDKLIIHYNKDAFLYTGADLSNEYLYVSFTRKFYGNRYMNIGIRIYLDTLDRNNYYTIFEASDFSEFDDVDGGFLGYDINNTETKCYTEPDVYSKYFGTLTQFKESRTNRWEHKLSGWHWCNSGKEYQIIDGTGRYHGNKSYSIMLYKKHRGVVSIHPCHVSIIRTNKKNVVDDADYLTFDITNGGTINWKHSGSTNRDLYYRISSDGGESYGDWNLISSDEDSSFNVDSNDKVQFKGNFQNYLTQNDSNYSTFSGSTATFNVSGNIMSIMKEENFDNLELTQPYAFFQLFACTNVADASEMKMPNIVSQACCGFMFRECRLLEHGPKLPAEELVQACYWAMFINCSKLQEGVEMSAVNMAYQSCIYMYAYCGSLTTLPELPATILGYGCYARMFQGCNSLTSIPSGYLPSTTLAEDCYAGMFSDCFNLTSIPSDLLPATTLKQSCYNSMFENCFSLTNVPNLPATDLSGAYYCYQCMFQGCKSLTGIPTDLLPATTLAQSCYSYMFRACTSLTSVPDLPATTLANYCYRQMFYNCGNINYIKCLATDISANQCTSDWVNGVQTASGTFVKHPDMNDWTTGTSGIPENWNVQIN